MTETIITCPHCGGEIPLTEALTARLHAEFDAQHQACLKAAVAEAELRAQAGLAERLAALQKQLDAQAEKARQAEALEIELRQKALTLEQGQAQAIEKARLDVQEKLRRETEEKTRALIVLTEKKAREDAALEKRMLESRLAEERKKLEAAQQIELELRKKTEDLEARGRELDLEVARKLDAKKTEWEAGLRQTLGVEQELKLKEKEKQIEDMKKVIDDLKRKSEQGSQELQGEVLELDIQAALERQFPQDHIEPVAKGARGADIVQRVRNDRLEECGAIVWETKNTKHWQSVWLDKLKADQRAAGAAIAVLVSVTLPEGMGEFARLEGVWVASRHAYPALAVALREQLIQTAFARTASEGRHDKMELLYNYLAGDEFRQRVETIVEAFTALRAQLDKERRAMTRHWAEREKQIERVIGSTTGMYGALQGIIGQGMPAIPALELDDTPLLEGEE